MRARLMFGISLALAACSVKPVTFTPETPAVGDDAGLPDPGRDAAVPDAPTIPDGPTFTASVMLLGNGTGTVTSNPDGISCGTQCSHAYPPGTEVTLTPVAAADSTFVSWSAPCTETPCKVSIDQATTVTARFDLQPRTLQITRSGPGAGVVTSMPDGISCGAACTASYDAHTMVTLMAAPNADSALVAWSGGGCSGNASCTVTLDDAATVNAQFGFRSFDLSLDIAGSGTGSVAFNPPGTSCTGDCTQSYLAHTVVTLTPTPSGSSLFAGWGGACTGTGPCQVTMASAVSVSASFSQPGHLFTIDETLQPARLQRLEPTTKLVSDIGPLGIGYAFGDCAWSFASATLFVVDGRGAQSLYRVNLATGAASLVGVHGLTDLFSLGYHPPSNQLFGVAGGMLYKISSVNGAATLVGPTGLSSVDGLAWDSKRNVMLALNANLGGSVIFSINLATGAATQLAPVMGFNNLGMAYDPGLDKLFVVDYDGNVAQLDPANGFARLNFGTIPDHRTCLTFIP